MIAGMTVKRTFSLPDELSRKLDRVADGNASAYVARALAYRVDRDLLLRRLDELLGPVTDPEAIAWARRTLGLPPGTELPPLDPFDPR
jgi:hypothetical protein